MINHRLISSDTIDDLLNSVYRIIQEKGSEVPASRGKKQIIKEITGKRRRSPIVVAPHRNVLEKVASHEGEDGNAVVEDVFCVGG